jgi:amidohydrolase
MPHALLLALCAGAAEPPSAAFPPRNASVAAVQRPMFDAVVTAAVDEQVPSLVELYAELHRQPELSLAESRTAARLAKELKKAGFTVTKDVGGTGVVAVLARGEGPVVLMRTDMDALPVQEASASPTPSQVPGVMHACGHDVHMASVVGAARVLAKVPGWVGTVVVIAQPAEEVGQGARAMLADGLFERFPAPDEAIALHVSHGLPAGTVELTSGWVNANVDMVDITFHGRGGHGARPHDAVDPIVAASAFVTGVQTVVSRRLPPTEPGVITVGAFQAGTKGNVIPDRAALQLTVRSASDEARALLLDGIRQIAAGTCEAMGCTAPPDVVVRDEFTPASYNHPGLTEVARATFGRVLGAEQVRTGAPEMVGEDFGQYSRALNIPALQYRLGTAPAGAFGEDGAPLEPLPGLHSAAYVPDPGPSIRTGALSLTSLALTLLGS